MQGNKVKVEIFEGDPFEGSCCGPNPMSKDSTEMLRRMLTERNEILTRLREKFHGTIDLDRDIYSTRRSLMSYPEHVRTILSERGLNSLPLIFIEGKLVSAGKFPSYEEFLTLLNRYLEQATSCRQ